MNAQLLKGAMLMKGYTVRDMVKAMSDRGNNISVSTFYKKMKGTSEFTVSEIKSITEIAGFSNQEMNEIFFTELVS